MSVSGEAVSSSALGVGNYGRVCVRIPRPSKADAGPKEETRGARAGGRDGPASPSSGSGASGGRRWLKKDPALLEWVDPAVGVLCPSPWRLRPRHRRPFMSGLVFLGVFRTRYQTSPTRVVCNPRGFPGLGLPKHPQGLAPHVSNAGARS